MDDEGEREGQVEEPSVGLVKLRFNVSCMGMTSLLGVEGIVSNHEGNLAQRGEILRLILR